jgi:hypothetical protein
VPNCRNLQASRESEPIKRLQLTALSVNIFCVLFFTSARELGRSSTQGEVIYEQAMAYVQWMNWACSILPMWGYKTSASIKKSADLSPQ